MNIQRLKGDSNNSNKNNNAMNIKKQIEFGSVLIWPKKILNSDDLTLQNNGGLKVLMNHSIEENYNKYRTKKSLSAENSNGLTNYCHCCCINNCHYNENLSENDKKIMNIYNHRNCFNLNNQNKLLSKFCVHNNVEVPDNIFKKEKMAHNINNINKYISKAGPKNIQEETRNNNIQNKYLIENFNPQSPTSNPDNTQIKFNTTRPQNNANRAKRNTLKELSIQSNNYFNQLKFNKNSGNNIRKTQQNLIKIENKGKSYNNDSNEENLLLNNLNNNINNKKNVFTFYGNLNNNYNSNNKLQIEFSSSNNNSNENNTISHSDNQDHFKNSNIKHSKSKTIISSNFQNFQRKIINNIIRNTNQQGKKTTSNSYINNKDAIHDNSLQNFIENKNIHFNSEYKQTKVNDKYNDEGVVIKRYHNDYSSKSKNSENISVIDINNINNNILMNNNFIINENVFEFFKSYYISNWKQKLSQNSFQMEFISTVSNNINTQEKQQKELEYLNNKDLNDSNEISDTQIKSNQKYVINSKMLNKTNISKNPNLPNDLELEKEMNNNNNNNILSNRKMKINSPKNSNNEKITSNNSPPRFLRKSTNKFAKEQADCRSKNNLNKIDNPDTYIYIVIDDNLHIRNAEKNLLKIYLKNLKKNLNLKQEFEVIDGGDGIDALKYVIDPNLSSRIKAIFIDENMEYMNGSEAIKIIRKFQSLNKIQKFNIATVTAFEDNITKLNIIQAGVDEIYGKPFSKNHLEDFFKKFPIK